MTFVPETKSDRMVDEWKIDLLASTVDPLLWYASVCQPGCIWCCCGDGREYADKHIDCPVHDKTRGLWPWRALASMSPEQRIRYVKEREELKKRELAVSKV